MTDNAAGWQADPTGRHEHRYWDGTAWTDNVSDAGVASTDAYIAEDVAPDVTPEPEEPGWADPTAVAAAPTTDPTSTWPTSPAPPPPPSYTPPVPGTGGPIGPDGSGGSKKGLFIGIGVLAAVAVVVAVLLAGGGDEDDSIRTQLAAQFRANSGLSDDQADCVADYVVDEMGEDSFDGVDFSSDDPPDEIADDMFGAAFDSLESCDIDPADFAGADDDDDSDGGDGTYGSDPELDALYDACEDGDYEACDDLYNQSPSGSEYEEFGDTCGDRNEPSGYCVDVYGEDGGDSTDGAEFGSVDQIADIYESSMGIPRDKAECLAEKITELIESGEINQEEAMSDVFEYLSDCDIDMSEINPNN